MRFSYLYVLLLLITCSLRGQVPAFENTDTILINEVIIKGISSQTAPGYKYDTVDSAILESSWHRSIADVLIRNSPVIVKSYGMGGTATPSFRGTGAGSTQVTWNGIKVDHPMLGQADLSLLPAGITDNLSIYYGGASMAFNSGAAGGIIALESKPLWNKRTEITFNPSTGSFDRYTGLISVRSGNLSFQSVTKGYFQYAANNFRYVNRVSLPEPFTDTRRHSEGIQKGLLQELYFRKSGNVLSVRFWYQVSERNLPASLLIYPEKNGGEQEDEHARIMLDYDLTGGKNKYFITTALMHSVLNYTNSVSEIDSRNVSDVIVLRSGLKSDPGKFGRFEVIFNEELTHVNSNNYMAISFRNTANISASLTNNDMRTLNWNFLVRQILHGKKLLLPDFSGGVGLKLSASGDYLLNANFSRNSRVPSMNDLYWYPGGNTELKNEYAYISEIGCLVKESLSESVKVDFSLTTFNNNIKDMVQWIPGAGSFWTAENIGRVKTYGLETSLSVRYSYNSFSAALKGNYSYTRAFNRNPPDENRNEKRQLIYIPDHQANMITMAKFRNFSFGWNSALTGRRYIDAGNSRYLHAFFVNGVTAGVILEPDWGMLELNFDIDNIFNSDYQTMAYYPMPGRSFDIRLTFKFINT